LRLEALREHEPKAKKAKKARGGKKNRFSRKKERAEIVRESGKQEVDEANCVARTRKQRECDHATLLKASGGGLAYIRLSGASGFCPILV